MLVPREWNDVPEVFEVVADAINSSEEMDVYTTTEQSSYREDGSIVVRLNGRTFHISISEHL